jgi:putative phage-type endonuclease
MLQRTPEWREARLAKVTGSRIADVVATIKSGGWGASRANYMADLIAERLTGVPTESYTSAAMAHGIATEPEARTAYEFLTDASVELVGFINHPRIPMAGASPDGLIGTDGLIEIKCPTSTHIGNLLGPSVDDRYKKQINRQLACTERQWCDLVSFDPRMPPEMQVLIRRVHRDGKMIRELENAVVQFLRELEEKIAGLQRLYGVSGIAA